MNTRFLDQLLILSRAELERRLEHLWHSLCGHEKRLAPETQAFAEWIRQHRDRCSEPLLTEAMAYRNRYTE